MTLGEKLQTVYQKVNTKLGTQDGTVVFRKVTETPAAEFGVRHSSTSNSNVTITDGIKISRLKAYDLDRAGMLQIGDLKLEVPGNLITEAQLTDAKIIYGGLTWGILKKTPKEILGGVVTAWIVLAREER